MSQSFVPKGHSAIGVDPSAVPADARVVHFDQLDDDARDWLVAQRAGDADVGMLPDGLGAGDVVVFTEYLRVTER